jgi:hypothetical protein
MSARAFSGQIATHQSKTPTIVTIIKSFICILYKKEGRIANLFPINLQFTQNTV